MTMAPRILGVGNRHRGDDGVGPYVLAGLVGRIPAGQLLSADGEVSGLLDIFGRERDLILVDAADGPAAGLAPGTVRRMHAGDPDLGSCGLRASTHALGVAEAIALARSLDALPERLVVIAIAGSNFTPGAELSEPVVRAADALIDELAGDFVHA
jgi:hydrogenase maturation protease